MIHPTTKVSEEVNRNTMVQLLALYIDAERHNTQRHRQTDRQTDRRHDDAKTWSYCVQYDRLKS